MNFSFFRARLIYLPIPLFLYSHFILLLFCGRAFLVVFTTPFVHARPRLYVAMALVVISIWNQKSVRRARCGSIRPS